jgi:hypothetical protein
MRGAGRGTSSGAGGAWSTGPLIGLLPQAAVGPAGTVRGTLADFTGAIRIGQGGSQRPPVDLALPPSPFGHPSGTLVRPRALPSGRGRERRRAWVLLLGRLKGCSGWGLQSRPSTRMRADESSSGLRARRVSVGLVPGHLDLWPANRPDIKTGEAMLRPYGPQGDGAKTCRRSSPGMSVGDASVAHRTLVSRTWTEVPALCRAPRAEGS